MRFESGAASVSVRRGSRCARVAAGRWVGWSRRSPSFQTPAKSQPTPARARRGSVHSRSPMAFRGRHWIAFWLVALLAALWAVIARQTASLNAARALADLREQRASLEGHRADLERRVRTAQSRTVLLPRAQRQGLRLPADTEIILIPAPAPNVPPRWRPS